MKLSFLKSIVVSTIILSTLPLINLSSCSNQSVQTTYTISYSNIPIGVTLTRQPTTTLEKTKVSVDYTLLDGYYIDYGNCKIYVNDKDVSNDCSILAQGIVIPAEFVTGNILIVLAVTQEVPMFSINYTGDSKITWSSSNPTSIAIDEDLVATYTITDGYKLDMPSCKILAGNRDITKYISFSNGIITIPESLITNKISINLVTTQDLDTGTVTATTGGAYILTSYELKERFNVDIIGIQKVIYLLPINRKLKATISGSFTDTVILLDTEKSTYDLTFDNLNISNSVSNNRNAPSVFLANSHNNSTINLTLNGTNTLIDKRSNVGSNYYSENATFKSESPLTISGDGKLKINDLNQNNGLYAKGIQITNGSSITIQSGEIDVFAIDDAINCDGVITINGGDITVDSYSEEGIKTIFSSPSEDIKSNTLNVQKDIKINGGNVTVYSAKNGINSAHDVVVSSNPNIQIYTSRANAGDKVGKATLDEMNMYVRIPFKWIPYGDMEEYFFTVTFNNGQTEYLSLEKINQSRDAEGKLTDCYYYFKCKRPLSSDCSSFVINQYTIGNFGAQEMTPLASSQLITIPCPTSQSIYTDTVTVTSIVSSSIKCSSILDSNYESITGSEFPYIDTTISSKGIIATNKALLNGGTINIKSNDSGIYASYGKIYCESSSLGDTSFSVGDITIEGSDITITSNEKKGIDSGATVWIKSGNVTITQSQIGISAGRILVNDGITKIFASKIGVIAEEKCKWNIYKPVINNKVTLMISGGVLDVQAINTQDSIAIISKNIFTITNGLTIARVLNNSSTAIDSKSNKLTINSGTLLVCGTIKATLTGFAKSYEFGQWYKNKTYLVKYGAEKTYKFSNIYEMDSSCKWYSNYDVTVEETIE